MAFIQNPCISPTHQIGSQTSGFLSNDHANRTAILNVKHLCNLRRRHRNNYGFPSPSHHNGCIYSSPSRRDPSMTMSATPPTSTFPSTSTTFTTWQYKPLLADPVIGFIGLGIMGLPMLNNLTKSFNKFVVWNRTVKGLSPIMRTARNADKELYHAPSPGDVVQSADITFCMLSTPEAIRSVYYDCDSPALAGVTKNKVIVDCSTMQQDIMTETYRHILLNGGAFLEAPVSGSKDPAVDGQLIFICSGDKPVYDDPVTQSAFKAMGKRSFYLGPVGNATKMKLVINQLMATMLAALGESIVLTEAADLSVPNLLEILSLGALGNRMFDLKGPQMQDNVKRHDPHFALKLALKDIRFAQALAKEYGVRMSVSNTANQLYKESQGLGLNKEDFCSVVETIREGAQRK